MGLKINLYDKEKTAKTTAHIRKISIALFFINKTSHQVTKGYQELQRRKLKGLGVCGIWYAEDLQ